MKQRDLTAAENFVRVCSRQKQILGVEGELLGVTWEAFALRQDKNEKYVSGACREVFAGTLQVQIKNAANSILNGFGPSVKKASYAVVVIKVEEIIGAGKRRDKALRVRLEPKRSNHGYATIRQLPLDNSDSELLKILANPQDGLVELFSNL